MTRPATATPAQLDALRQMAEHGPLRFVKGGWWTWEGCPTKLGLRLSAPVWSTTIGTLAACERNGWAGVASVGIPDGRPEVYRERYDLTDAGRAIVDGAA